MTAGTRLAAPRGSVVGDAEVRTYYDRPVLKAPVWTREVPWYVFAGGLAGASAVLAAAARRSGNEALAGAAARAAAAGALVSPALLVADLGRPERFHHMLRVAKPTSPMSVGTWVLTIFGPASVLAGLLRPGGRLGPLQRAAEGTAATLGPVMATYTAVLFANTAIPVWHEARTELPFVFASSAAAAAGGAAALTTPPASAGPARRLAAGAALVELGAARLMERRLGFLGRPYREGDAGRYGRAARWCSAAGAALVGLGGTRRRPLVVAGSGLVLAGSACQRWAVYRAGFQSARDPAFVIAHQRGTTGPATAGRRPAGR